MRFPLLVALSTSIALAGTFWYQSTAHICPVPLSYRLGKIDSHFTLSQEEANAALALAEQAWEGKTGRDLFVSDEQGSLVIDFVFDDRQAEANAEGARRQALDQTLAETETLKQRLEDLESEYQIKTAEYENDVRSYETALLTYNEQVARYNDQGGAPEAVRADLERERVALDARLQELNREADTLNTLGQTINSLGEKNNQLVAAYNQEVEAYNAEFGFAKEFTQGDYQDGKISIYTFSSKEELVSVLVHEFGHALGIGHVEDSSAVMYYLLQEENTTPVLTDSDLEAFTTVCGTGDERGAAVRRLIREFIRS